MVGGATGAGATGAEGLTTRGTVAPGAAGRRLPAALSLLPADAAPGDALRVDGSADAVGGGTGSSAGEGDGDGDVPAETTAAFDAVNLYEFYRGIRALRARLSDPETSPHYQRSLLVGRPDSVWALAHLADGAAEAPIVRHLVLRELRSVFIQWIELVEADLVARVEHVADRARTVALRQLELELGDEGSNAERMLDWLEDKLASLDRRVA